MNNRRSNTRVKITGMMVDAVITYTDTLAPARGGTVADVSRNGIFLETDATLSENAYVSLRLNTQRLIGKPLWAQGFVARTGGNGLGIRFTYVEQDIMKLFFS